MEHGEAAVGKERFSEILQLEKVMEPKIKWVGTIYASFQAVTTITKLAQGILGEALGQEVVLQWIQGKHKNRGAVRVYELEAQAVKEWPDSTRLEEVAPGAIRRQRLYLGALITVAYAQLIGISPT